MFALCSVLIPAGYGNDDYFYQCPNQQRRRKPKIVKREEENNGGGGAHEQQNHLFFPAESFSFLFSSSDEPLTARVVQKIESGKARLESEFKAVEKKVENLSGAQCCKCFGDAFVAAVTEFDFDDFEDAGDVTEIPPHKDSSRSRVLSVISGPQMKSGRFLLLYTVFNVLLLSSSTTYIATTKSLKDRDGNALIIPQLIAVIPGCFFALARVLIYQQTPTPGTSSHPLLCCLCLKISTSVQRCLKLSLVIAFVSLGYFSVIPALVSGFAFKMAAKVGLVDFTRDEDDGESSNGHWSLWADLIDALT